MLEPGDCSTDVSCPYRFTFLCFGTHGPWHGETLGEVYLLVTVARTEKTVAEFKPPRGGSCPVRLWEDFVWFSQEGTAGRASGPRHPSSLTSSVMKTNERSEKICGLCSRERSQPACAASTVSVLHLPLPCALCGEAPGVITHQVLYPVLKEH